MERLNLEILKLLYQRTTTFTLYVNLTYTLDGAIRNKSDHVIYLKQTATARIFF